MADTTYCMVWALVTPNLASEITQAEQAYKKHYGKTPVYAKVNPARPDLHDALVAVGYVVEYDRWVKKFELWLAEPFVIEAQPEPID